MFLSVFESLGVSWASVFQGGTHLSFIRKQKQKGWLNFGRENSNIVACWEIIHKRFFHRATVKHYFGSFYYKISLRIYSWYEEYCSYTLHKKSLKKRINATKIVSFRGFSLKEAHLQDQIYGQKDTWNKVWDFQALLVCRALKDPTEGWRIEWDKWRPGLGNFFVAERPIPWKP